MKKTISILLVTAMLLSINVYSFAIVTGVPTVEIENVNKKEIADALVSYMMDNGYSVIDMNDYQISFGKDAEITEIELAFGEPRKELRIFVNIVQLGNNVKLTAEGKLFVKPNTLIQETMPVENDQIQIQPILDEIKFEFNGIIQFGITFDKKKKNGCYPVNSVIKNSSTEKAGIEVGDLIVAVNGKRAKEVNFKTFNSYFIVPDGTSLTLLIRKPSGEEIETTITKEFIPGRYQKTP